MSNKQIKEEIVEKEQKLLELRNILQKDTAASFKEATQTSEMIEILELNLFDLKHKLAHGAEYLKMITALNQDNVEQIFYVINNDGDPAQMRFSINAPFGKLLYELKINDEFKYKEETFRIKNINEKQA